ncbi:hypothetical protein [Aneurinibacillus aneurinilyticus]|nr:hypothetical protein [Aneurinibacillus aneurinilyticus]MED0705271.1 hypothetical protein [Aneurinibacillus aneurinilyticus]MED0722481.1 hypothetical protein [Aneurinibacillus aneurinilyticus]MED0733791.1 hypothetical protein [Aneurinibacillus aneurinilyticus]MED0739688.1 hypothetical protein [Aneurinibacillus aneurinilyticus]
MSNELSGSLIESKKKKSIFKRWWFWGLSIFVLIVVAIISSDGGSTAYELAKMQTMSKQQIIEKFGKPDEIVRDDKDGFMYGYHAGFDVRGTDKGALEINLSSDRVKKQGVDTYKIFDVFLGDSFDESVKKLGKPNQSGLKDGKKNAMYLTKEDFLLIFTTEYDSDKIAAIRYVAYDESAESIALDISKMLGLIATEEEIKKIFDIKDKNSNSDATTYSIEGFNMIVENQNNIVKSIWLTNGIYNIHGIRIGDSIDKANKLFGPPKNSSEGVKNTTQYIYKYEGDTNPKRIIISIDKNSKKIGYVEMVAS